MSWFWSHRANRSAIRRGRGGIATRVLVGAAAFPVVSLLLLRVAGAQPENPGRTAFERVCAGCHGSKASGDIGPPLVPFRLTDREVLAVVREGKGMMPALSARDISDEEIVAVAEYLRHLDAGSDKEP
jgi:mono/diheme cytochrome c family protein